MSASTFIFSILLKRFSSISCVFDTIHHEISYLTVFVFVKLKFDPHHICAPLPCSWSPLKIMSGECPLMNPYPLFVMAIQYTLLIKKNLTSHLFDTQNLIITQFFVNKVVEKNSVFWNPTTILLLFTNQNINLKHSAA